MKTTAMCLAFIICPTMALAQTPTTLSSAIAPVYAKQLGEGMRHYAEGRYDQAVVHLFQAYALKPESTTLNFIVLSYDFLGHCSAATNQRGVYQKAFPTKKSIKLQRCLNPSKLTVKCQAPLSRVRISTGIHVLCGQSIWLARGMYMLGDGKKIPLTSVDLSNTASHTVSLSKRVIQKWDAAQ